jgi:hypothetical protein
LNVLEIVHSCFFALHQQGSGEVRRSCSRSSHEKTAPVKLT